MKIQIPFFFKKINIRRSVYIRIDILKCYYFLLFLKETNAIHIFSVKFFFCDVSELR